MRKRIGIIIEYVKKLHEKGAFYIMCGNFATKFVTFFGSIVLARLLSKGDLGILAYMENLCSYAYLLLGLGMGNAILRYNIICKTRGEQKGIVLYSIKRGLISDVVLVAVVLLINIVYPHNGEFSIAKNLIPILIIALPFQDIINMVQMNERSFFSNRRYALFSVGSAFLIVLGRMIGAWAHELQGVIIAVVIVNIILSALMGTSSYRKYFNKIEKIAIRADQKKEASAYGLQYMVTNGLWGFFMLIDIFLLGHIGQNAAEVADYKIAVSFPANMAILSSALGIFVASYFIKNENNKEWVRINYVKLLKWGTLMQFTIGLLLFLLSKPLIWLFGTQYYNVIPLMDILIIGYFIETAFRFPTANILASIGKVKYNMAISAAGLLMEIVLDIILIPHYGAYGIAITTIIVRAAMAVALFAVINRIYNVIQLTE